MLGARLTLQDYKTVLCHQEDGSWVAEIPAISGCYALMSTREEALAELGKVFEMIAQEYHEIRIRSPQGHYRDRACPAPRHANHRGWRLSLVLRKLVRPVATSAGSTLTAAQ
jgi:predicted RNase H-like HicB family nuclease